MRREVVLLLRAAVADVRAHQQQGRPLVIILCIQDGFGDVVRIVSVRHHARVPALRLETAGDVFGENQAGGAGQRNMIVIVKANQLAQAKMARQRGGFGGHTLH